MTATLCLTEQHLQRFAAASGDRNPLHVDELFARATPYGRCIAHGALVSMAALASAEPIRLAGVKEMDIQFKLPVFPGERYRVSCAHRDATVTRIEVTAGGRLATAITVVADHDDGPVAPVADEAGFEGAAPQRHTIEDLQTLGGPIVTRYGCRIGELRALATELGGHAVPDAVLSWLAAASYTVGMLVPGRDAVFVGARIRRSPAAAAGTLAATVTAADDRTGLVMVDGVLEQEAGARMSLHAFLRPPAPPPDRASVSRHVGESSRLAGRNVLVVGASRGLGAAVSGALALQGATVWAAYARSVRQAEALQRQFGADRIKLLQFDAADASGCGSALETLSAHAPALDGVVLCAAPARHETALHPDTLDATLRFVDASVAMTVVPLTGALPMLSRGGWIVVTSSPAVDPPPAGWPHYAMAKAAVEAAAAYCARHTHARVLVVRPPTMWTDGANTPLARLGAVPPELVAAAIVDRMMTAEPDGSPLLLTADDILAARAHDASAS